MRVYDPAGVYSKEEVIAALQAENGTRHVSFRFERLTSRNVLIDELDYVAACSVSNNMLADIKRTAKFTIKDGGAVNYLSDRIKPYVRLQMADGGIVEWPQGVFLLSTPSRVFKSGAAVFRDVEGYDQLLVLQDDKVETRYTVTSGTVYTTAIATLLTSLNLATNITASTLTLPATMEWEPGTSRLQILNDLLASINYESAFFDEEGTLICHPYVSPASHTSEYSYLTDNTSLIMGDTTQTLDLFAIPNKWVLVVSDPDRPALTATYTNSSLSSPTSTVSRGRTIVDFRTEQQAADQTTLNAKAERLAFNASQVYEIVEFETAIMPVHQNSDVYSVDIDGLDIASTYSEHEWSMDLKAGASMKHKVRRIVSVA